MIHTFLYLTNKMHFDILSKRVEAVSLCRLMYFAGKRVMCHMKNYNKAVLKAKKYSLVSSGGKYKSQHFQ